MEIVQPKKTGSGRSRKGGGKEHPMGMKCFRLMLRITVAGDVDVK